MTVQPNVILEMCGIEKSFNGIPVLKRADFTLHQGEVHGLMGGNGAGKSTLMKILTGVYSKDAGTVTLDGKAIDIASPLVAEEHGIAMIFQEFSLVPTLTVAQNIFLTREPRRVSGLFIDEAEMIRKARSILAELGEDIDPETLVEDLTVGRCQMVEIAKALSKNARVLVMDEPTSSISEVEVGKLFDFINRLKKTGISFIYISHRMAEIAKICDRVSIMRDGEKVLTDVQANLSMEVIIDAMLGSSAGTSLQWRERTHVLGTTPGLAITNLSSGNKFQNITMSVFPGEVVGLAGLMGSGRTEILETIFGLNTPDSGAVQVGNKLVVTTQDAIAAGIALIPESRRLQGLNLSHSILDNYILPNIQKFTKLFFVDTVTASNSALKYVSKLKIKCDGVGKEVGLLSGGNQQKVVLSKWLAMHPTVLLLDEPTIGVDIGAKADIVQLVRQLASEGTAILVVSSEFEELLAMSDRIIVLKDGVISANLDRKDVISEDVLHHAVQS